MNITRRSLLQAAGYIGAAALLDKMGGIKDLTVAADVGTNATVTACCWNGDNLLSTLKLGSYFTPSTTKDHRFRRMLDYLTGACAFYGWQAVIGHALAAIEHGVTNTSDGWLQLKLATRQDFITSFWTPNNPTGLTPTTSEVGLFDFLNAAAGIWYFNSMSPGSLGVSYKAVQWKATQYNFGPGSPNMPAGCMPSGTSYNTPSAYAWTLSFLAWGNSYASVTDASYGHPTSPQRYARMVTDTGSQSKYLNDYCSGSTQLTVPTFTPTYQLLTTPHGRRSNNKQLVILARSPGAYVSGLAVGLNLLKANSANIAPIVTADTYFAVDCMKNQSGTQNGTREVCVIVVGTNAKNDVAAVYSGASAFATYTGWAGSTANGFIDAATGATQADNWVIARDQGTAAYNAGF
jgi:hypothetical protein